jgi:hypothetical protein
MATSADVVAVHAGKKSSAAIASRSSSEPPRLGQLRPRLPRCYALIERLFPAAQPASMRYRHEPPPSSTAARGRSSAVRPQRNRELPQA